MEDKQWLEDELKWEHGLVKVCSKKDCLHQGQPQPIGNFRNYSRSPDGKAYQCNDCVRVYAERAKQNGSRKKILDKYTKTDKFKATKKKYRQTDKGKVAIKRYNQSEKGKIVSHRRDRKNADRYKTDLEYKNKVLARSNVYYHVQRGNIPPAATLTCFICGEPAGEYHHYLGYEREHWLDIKPICIKHHRNLASGT